MARTFLSNSAVQRSDATKALNFGYVFGPHCMTSQLKDFKVPKTGLETEVLLSHMKQLQFGILAELWSSLLEQFSATSLALQSPRLDLNDSIPMLSSLADFFESPSI